MPRFSILVPHLGSTLEFEDTLASVLRYRSMDTEVVVAHDGNYHDPHQLDSEVIWAEVVGQPRLIRLFNEGVAKSNGDWIVVVRPGVELDENWEVPVLDSIAEGGNVGSITPILSTVGRGSKIVSAGVTNDHSYVRRLVGTDSRNAPRSLQRLRPKGPSSWLAVYRKTLLDQIGPVCDSLDDAYLDIDLALSLNQLGFKTRFEPEFIGLVESAKPVIDEARKPHGKSAQRAFARHAGLSPSANTVPCVVWDLVQTPISPWLAGHAFQRLGASKWIGEDKKFASRLKQIRTLRSWEGTDTPENFDITIRRAA